MGVGQERRQAVETPQRERRPLQRYVEDAQVQQRPGGRRAGTNARTASPPNVVVSYAPVSPRLMANLLVKRYEAKAE